jgi:exodeoxyribonuclease V alpha subunit
MPELQSLTKTRITGEILNMRFENPENGFAVLTFLSADGTKFAVIGPLAGMTRGQLIEADGYFEDHPEFGRQFRIDSYKIVPPVTTDGIARFLRHSIPGIGPKRRLALIRHFKSIDAIKEASVEEIADAPGMNLKAAQAVADALKS